MDKFKKDYIDKLDDATKRAVSFINNLEEGNDKDLENLSLRKLIFTVLKIKNIETYNQIMRYMKWEQHYLNDKNYDDWVKRSTGNFTEDWMESLYELTNKPGDDDIDKYIIKEKRREDLEKYFKLEKGTFHSDILVYEGQPGELYTVVLCDEPYWGGENHITMRGQSKLFESPELAQEADRWGSQEWISHRIAENSLEDQKMLKSYKYNNVLFMYFIFAQRMALYTTKQVVFDNESES